MLIDRPSQSSTHERRFAHDGQLASRLLLVNFAVQMLRKKSTFQQRYKRNQEALVVFFLAGVSRRVAKFGAAS